MALYKILNAVDIQFQDSKLTRRPRMTRHSIICRSGPAVKRGREMIEIAGIDHLVLRTTNITAMLNFYVHVLGCTVERETSTDTGLTQLRAGNALIDLVVVDSRLGNIGGGAPTTTENNMDHFCLQLKPTTEQAIIHHLKAKGIETPDFTERYGAQGLGNSIYIKDPDQNSVELRIQKP